MSLYPYVISGLWGTILKRVCFSGQHCKRAICVETPRWWSPWAKQNMHDNRWLSRISPFAQCDLFANYQSILLVDVFGQQRESISGGCNWLPKTNTNCDIKQYSRMLLVCHEGANVFIHIYPPSKGDQRLIYLKGSWLHLYC